MRTNATYNPKVMATYTTLADLLLNQSIDNVTNRTLSKTELDCIGDDELGQWMDGIPRRMEATAKVDLSKLQAVVHSLRADPNGGQEQDVYFYHSDLCKSRVQSQACLSYAEAQQSVRSNHLGSASWITDHTGQPVPHLQYLPYGEPYINQRLSNYSERFTFTGKERDEETGYGYFGARYMDHELITMWLSIDPMSDKYPSISPYAYCAWNPVKLVDPDGRDWYKRTNEDGKTTVEYCKDKSSCPANGEYIGLTFHDKENATYYPLYSQKAIEYDPNSHCQVDAVAQLEQTDNMIINTVNLIKGSRDFWGKHNAMYNLCSDLASAGVSLSKIPVLKKLVAPAGLYATGNAIVDYVDAIRTGSWDNSTTISLAATVASQLGGVYGNVISVYLNGINTVSQKYGELESSLRSCFSPMAPNNYFKQAWGF